MYWAEACCTVMNAEADNPAPRPPIAWEAAEGVPRVQQPLAQYRDFKTITRERTLSLPAKAADEKPPCGVHNGEIRQPHGLPDHAGGVLDVVQVRNIEAEHHAM